MGLTSDALGDKSQRWWHLSSIQLAGGIISFPVISVASQIFLFSGLLNTLLSVVIGNLVVLLTSYFIISMSFTKRLNAVENAQQFIGKLGGKVLAFFVLITMVGWVAWELLSGEKSLLTYPIFSKFSPGSLIGAAAALVLLIGIRGLKILCVATVIPLVMLLFMIVITSGTSPNSINIAFNYNFFDLLLGISLIISTSIAAVVDYPTFFRHSKSRKDFIIALIVIFIATSLIQLSGVFLFDFFAYNKDVVDGLSSNINISPSIIILFLIISMVSSVAWNVYAASVGWESLFPIFKDRTEYAVIGLVAIVLIGSINFEDVFILTSTFSDTIISGLGGVLIFEFLNKHKNLYFLENKAKIISSNVSWFLSSIVGLMVYFNLFVQRQDSTFICLISGFFISLILKKTITLIKLN